MGKVKRLEDLVVLAFISTKTRRPNKHGKDAVTAIYLEMPSLKTLFMSDVLIARLVSYSEVIGMTRWGHIYYVQHFCIKIFKIFNIIFIYSNLIS